MGVTAGQSVSCAAIGNIEKIDMVEIDELVVKVSKDLLPFTSSALADPRVTLYFQDGVEYIKNCSTKYDLIIVDSTDPIGPGEGPVYASFIRVVIAFLMTTA